MADLSFDSSLVVRIDENGLTCEDVERRLAAVLEEQGYVKDTYAQAIVDREANFPTALDMSGLNVAIPHCDVANVNKAAMCMGVLANPVDWHKMDEPDETCKVSVVCMLALTEAHGGFTRSLHHSPLTCAPSPPPASSTRGSCAASR